MRSFGHTVLSLLLVAICAACDDDLPVPPAATQPGESGSAGAAGASTLTADCSVAPSTSPDFLTYYTCDSAQKALLCTDGYPLLCTPIGRERGTVPAGGGCQLAKTEAEPAAKFELGDDCAPNTDFFWPDWPKGSFCLAEGGTTFCSHACHIDLHCADLAAASGVPSPFCGVDERCHLTAEAAGIR